jgi:transposase-like protein
MNTEELKQIALAAAKNIKTQQDLTEFQRMLTKVTVEAALNAELDDHLGYERHPLCQDSCTPPLREF